MVRKLVLAVILAVLAVPSLSSADLLVDDFNVATNEGFTVDLVGSTTPISGGYRFAGGFGNAGFITYTGDLSDFTDGFYIESATALGANFAVTVFDDMGNSVGGTTLFQSATPTTLSFSGLNMSTWDSFTIGLQSGSNVSLASIGGSIQGFSAVPEPTSLALVGLACGGLVLRRRRR